MVECQLPKLDAEGSNPFSRSIVSTLYGDPAVLAVAKIGVIGVNPDISLILLAVNASGKTPETPIPNKATPVNH